MTDVVLLEEGNTLELPAEEFGLKGRWISFYLKNKIPFLPAIAVSTRFARDFHKNPDLGPLGAALKSLREFSEILSPEGRSDRFFVLLDLFMSPTQTVDPEHRLRHIGFTSQNIDSLYHYLGGKDLLRAFRGAVRQALFYSHRAKGDLPAEAREDQISEKNEWSRTYLAKDEMDLLVKVDKCRGNKELRDLIRQEDQKPSPFFKKYFRNTLDQLRHLLSDLSVIADREGWGQYGFLIQPSLESRMGSENVMGSFVTSDLNTGRSDISGYYAPQQSEKTFPIEELPEHLLS
ncbi:MAG: hypothetical protein JNM63_15890, partial [Spirochaetia bacterium]|nr:hypothetical protein [Spirochaetia bacterium]